MLWWRIHYIEIENSGKDYVLILKRSMQNRKKSCFYPFPFIGFEMWAVCRSGRSVIPRRGRLWLRKAEINASCLISHGGAAAVTQEMHTGGLAGETNDVAVALTAINVVGGAHLRLLRLVLQSQQLVIECRVVVWVAWCRESYLWSCSLTVGGIMMTVALQLIRRLQLKTQLRVLVCVGQALLEWQSFQRRLLVIAEFLGQWLAFHNRLSTESLSSEIVQGMQLWRLLVIPRNAWHAWFEPLFGVASVGVVKLRLVLREMLVLVLHDHKRGSGVVQR